MGRCRDVLRALGALIACHTVTVRAQTSGNGLRRIERRGARTADMAIEQPTVFERVVNPNTAKALGITVPQSDLLRAGRVIE